MTHCDDRRYQQPALNAVRFEGATENPHHQRLPIFVRACLGFEMLGFEMLGFAALAEAVMCAKPNLQWHEADAHLQQLRLFEGAHLVARLLVAVTYCGKFHWLSPAPKTSHFNPHFARQAQLANTFETTLGHRR